MARERVIIDCYTDEPAGLGVPPFLGTWPRYLAGSYRDMPEYLTIDDMRAAALKRPLEEKFLDPPNGKTKKDFINLTRPVEDSREVLRRSKQFTFIVGVHTPGKYLSAIPGTLGEIAKLVAPYNVRKILVGPAAIGGSQATGGKKAEEVNRKRFEYVHGEIFDDYSELREIAIRGAAVIDKIPQRRIVEIETGRGCARTEGCSFCTEPLKSEPAWREVGDIIDEMKACMDRGADAFRLGKQSCLLSYENDLERLLKESAALKPQVLHMDNASPSKITEKNAKLCAEYLTPGSTAAMGVESFDPEVIRQNNLNSNFDETFEAIRILNEHGGERGENGCHKILPGINIVLGLIGETAKTLEHNFDCLKRILDSGMLVRRINIRQVVAFPGTKLHEEAGNKFLRKNKPLYRNWTRKVREEIDMVMLQRLFPTGTVLRELFSEVHEGNVTFMRHLGSYPIVTGVRQRLPLGEQFDVRVTGHNLRSLEAELVS